MKKNYNYVFLLFILFFISHETFGQGNTFYPGGKSKPTLNITAKDADYSMIYARVYGGLGLALAKTSIGTNTTITQTQTTITTVNETVNGSYGKGIFFGLGAGYRLFHNAGIGLDILDFIGSKYMFTTKSGNSVLTNESSLHGLSVRPVVTLFSNQYKSLTPFGELGIVLGITDKMTIKTENIMTTTTMVTTTVIKKTMTPAFKPGVFAGIGACWNITNTLGIMVELQAQGQSFTPRHDETNTFTVNGADKLSTLSVSQKETDYVKKITGPPSTDPGKPAQALTLTRNASSVNFLIGICYGFGKMIPSTPHANF